MLMTDRIVYSAVAVPNEPDWDGEILTSEEIRHAAHVYMKDHRIVDPEHVCAIGSCRSVGNPVESYITDEPMSVKGYDGSMIDLPSGSWIVGIDVFDDTTFEQIMNGEKRGVSLTAKRGDTATKSKRVLIRDLGDDWIARTVSIVRDPAVPKARFFYRNDDMTEKENAIESGLDRIVSAIKGLKKEDNVDDLQDLEVVKDQETIPENDDVVVDQQEVIEEDDVDEESVKSQDKIEEEEAVTQEFVTQDELLAAKSEILEVIKSLKPEPQEDKDLRIVELENEIKDLKGRLTSVKSKAIPDHYQEKEVVKGHDVERDLYGRVIKK